MSVCTHNEMLRRLAPAGDADASLHVILQPAQPLFQIKVDTETPDQKLKRVVYALDHQEQLRTPSVLWYAPFFSGGGYCSEAISYMEVLSRARTVSKWHVYAYR